jgi:uncharacterized protein (DUF3820 family)
MSSDYGSDIHSDEITAIDDAQLSSFTACSPIATPQQPLKHRAANIPATPPPSHIHLRKENERKVTTQGSNNGQQRVIQGHVSARSYHKLPPTPMTAPSSQSTYHVPPSSQPTPSRRPPAATPYQTSPAQSIQLTHCPPPSSQPTPSRTPVIQHISASLKPLSATAHASLLEYYVPPSMQPTPSRHCPAQPLYRFPFGSHRGKTLLEVPQDYLKLLRADQLMADSMTGFDEALRLYDASQSQYRFPFGTHRGKTLFEVPENYIMLLRIDQFMADNMTGFADALRLYDAGLTPTVPLPLPPPSQSGPAPPQSLPQGLPPLPQSVSPASQSLPPPSSAPTRAPTTPSPSTQTPPSSTPSIAPPTEYRFDFGIHTGKSLSEVPPEYLTFLKQRGIVSGKPTLSAAVAKHEQNTHLPPDPARYTLTFGKHIGEALSDVPSDYLTWLKKSHLLYENTALRDAIRHFERAVPAKRKRGSEPKATSSRAKKSK